MAEYNGKVKVSSKKRPKKRKSLEFVGWGSKNLIEFLESLGRDTTNRVSENDVTSIVLNYIREINRENTSNAKNKKKRKTKTVACDEKLRLFFECQKINITKVPDLVEKHYVENQDDSEYDFLYKSEDDEQIKRLCLSDKMDKQKKQVVVAKPKGSLAAIVSDNIKLMYLRKSLVQELAKTPETFESKVMGTFVRIKNPFQLVQVTGVKEGNLIDSNLLQVTNYSYYLKDVASSALSDDDFSQEECEELHQRIKNGFVKRLTTVDMEEKVRNLHEDVTKHWLARELVFLERRINQANEKGWRRELSQYLEKRELLKNPEEQSRLLCEVPEVVAEELEPECVDDVDGETENEFLESLKAQQSDKIQQLSDLPLSCIKEALQDSKLLDGENKPTRTASADDKDLHEDVEMIDLDNETQAQPNPLEIIELEPERVDDDGNIENQLMEPNPDQVSLETHQSDKEQQLLSVSPVSNIKEALQDSKLGDGEKQPTQNASAGDKDLHEDALEPLANAITQNNDSINNVDMIDLDNGPQRAQPNPSEIIELSSDDDEEEGDKGNNGEGHDYDPKRVMWFYEFPKGNTYGPFSLTELKKWNEDEYFVDIPDFKVWMIGQSVEAAVSLTKLLSHIKI